MTSDGPYQEAFVWIWLPGETAPIVAGKFIAAGDQLLFHYGKSYLARDNAIALYEPELPLQAGLIPLLPGLSMSGCIRDGSPDAWGRRVIINRKLGRAGEIDDPVLRYMMDALAADLMLGEVTPQAYALGDCEPGQEHTKTIEWEAKGVTPILYQVSSGSQDHSAPHNTLKTWAETYRDGIPGKERIVDTHALAQPSASTRQDDFLGRMLWALSDASGLPAKRFADNPSVPALAWLRVFSDDRYRHGDLARFGVPPHPEVDDELRFSLIRRPAPYNRAPWMALVSGGAADSEWDNVMSYLARWLTLHLNDPALIIWVAQQGGRLHDRWAWLIEEKLDYFASLEQKGKVAELEEIRADAPNAIPGPLMQTLWRLLLTGRVKSPRHSLDLRHWKNRLKRDGLTATLRLQLRELLAPKIALKEPFRWGGGDADEGGPGRLRQLVDWELVLASGNVCSWLSDPNDERWREALPALLEDFQRLLRDALDLPLELGETNNHGDHSYLDLPSITSHWQNKKPEPRDWVALIKLLRDAWQATREKDPERATRIAQGWYELPYPTFALFAASHGCIAPDQWIDWLIADDARWLWSAGTQRETMRLLVLQGANLSPETRAMLEAAILEGPPRAMYPDDIEPENWQLRVERSVWLHLAKLQERSGRLGDAATRRFDELSVKNPGWRLASHERDEFPYWISGTGDPDHEDYEANYVYTDRAPRKRKDLVKWLKQPAPAGRPFYEDTWPETYRTRFFHSCCALCDLAQEGLWPARRWRQALQTWSGEGRVLRSWRFAAPLVQTMPEDVFQETAHSITSWLEAISGSIDRHEAILLDLCRRVLALPHRDDGDTDRPVARAINHPVGHATQALLNLWFKREPNDNDGLPQDIEPIFTRLYDLDVQQFRHGRVLLASRLIALFRVDRRWTETHLLPLFIWEANAKEAKAAWEGFLWSPRLYTPLLLALKSQFLKTAHHYEDLSGEFSRQYATFLTYAALDRVDGYTAQEFQAAFGALPQEGLQEAARALWQMLEGAGELREAYWKNRIRPFWQHIWPKSRELMSERIAESLARLSIAAGGEFPDALAKVRGWLLPIEHPEYALHLLHESGLARRFPQKTLSLLDAVLDKQPWVSRELPQLLQDIAEAAPELAQDPRYQGLLQYSRQHRV